MSHEKKKLAGVLGNCRPSYDPVSLIMDQEPQQEYPIRVNPMDYTGGIPSRPLLTPTDMGLAAARCMVDNTCMAPVMQEPLTQLHEGPHTGVIPPAECESTMENVNPIIEEQSMEEEMEERKLKQKQPHCFVCDTKQPEDIETSVNLFKMATSKTNKKFNLVVAKLIGRSITPRKSHSEIICRRCFNLLDRIDTLEIELKESKDQFLSMCKETMGHYGGKARRKRTVVSRKATHLYTRQRRRPKVEPKENPEDFPLPPKREKLELSMADHRVDDEDGVDQGGGDDDDDDDELPIHPQDPCTSQEGLDAKHGITHSSEESVGGEKKKRKRKYKATHLTSLQRATVINLRQRGWSFTRIANDLGFSRRTAKRVMLQYEEEGTIEKKKRSKHHRVTSAEEDLAIVGLLTDYPFKTASAIKNELGLTASVRTVLKRIRELRTRGIVKPLPPNETDPNKANKPRRRPKKPKVPQIRPEPPINIPMPKEPMHTFNEPDIFKDSTPLNPFHPGASFYKDMKDPSAYKANNEAHFHREKAVAMNYYNDPSAVPPFYQQFYH